MITEGQLKHIRLYCCEDFSKIENYDKAFTDLDVRYDCHHKLEIGNNGEVISKKDLIDHGLYWKRPASELVFLTKSEHMKLHHKGKLHSEESRMKMSETRKGKPNGRLGKHLSEESRRKISEKQKGRAMSEERKDKIRNTLTGTHQSIETRMKRSESIRKWWARRKMAKE